MKISEFAEMQNYMTRKDARPPEVQKALAEKRAAAEVIRKNNKRKEYGLSPIEDKKIIDQVVAYSPKKVQGYLPGLEPGKIEKILEIGEDLQNPDMVKQVRNSVANNKNPGSFQRLVKEDEDANKKAGVLKYIDTVKNNYNDNDPVETRSRQTVATISTANKILNDQVKKGNIKKEDLILKADPNGLLTNKNKTIAMRDSFMAKQFNKALGVNDEPEASPKQFGQLAERLEKDRQMRGEPTNIQRFEKNFKNINSKKPIIKKPFKRSGPIEPVKINFDDYKHFVEPPRIEKDPRAAIMEARFKEIQKQTHDEKVKRETTGLAGLLNGGKKFI